MNIHLYSPVFLGVEANSFILLNYHLNLLVLVKKAQKLSSVLQKHIRMFLCSKRSVFINRVQFHCLAAAATFNP